MVLVELMLMVGGIIVLVCELLCLVGLTRLVLLAVVRHEAELVLGVDLAVGRVRLLRVALGRRRHRGRSNIVLVGARGVQVSEGRVCGVVVGVYICAGSRLIALWFPFQQWARLAGSVRVALGVAEERVQSAPLDLALDGRTLLLARLACVCCVAFRV